MEVKSSNQKRLDDLPRESRAWLAGFFDGEGWVTLGKQTVIRKNGNQYDFYQSKIGIANTDEAVILYIQSLIDGEIYIRDYGDSHKKISYRWICAKKAEKEFLISVLPFLKIKAERVQLYINWLDTKMTPFNQGKRRILTKETLAKRQDIYDKLKWLNKKGQ